MFPDVQPRVVCKNSLARRPALSTCESVNVVGCGAQEYALSRERECRKRFSVAPEPVWKRQIWVRFGPSPFISCLRAQGRLLDVTVILGSRRRAWHLAMRLRKALEDDDVKFRLRPREARTGGKERNKHVKLKAGRGAVGKTPLWASGTGPRAMWSPRWWRRPTREPCKVSWPPTPQKAHRSTQMTLRTRQAS